jgi:2-amino-4-hydroxy-6-hydroxymethyldihydropteridine diphosphokinase
LSVVYFGLGSNLGDREALIREAVSRLDAPDLRLRKLSRLYETEPEGIRDQPWFLNAAAEFESELSPRQLLERAQAVERAMGRIRTVKNGPRNIDVDLLLCGDSIVNEPDLIVPHARCKERRFVLDPLLELNPNLKDPLTGQPLEDTLRKLP